MIDIMKEAFWATATQLTELIVPIIALWFIFKIAASLLLRDRA